MGRRRPPGRWARKAPRRRAPRHGAPRQAADNELLGWGLFSATVCALCLGLAGAGWLLAAGVGALVALVFGVVWAASVVGGQRPRGTTAEHAAATATRERREPVDVHDL